MGLPLKEGDDVDTQGEALNFVVWSKFLLKPKTEEVADKIDGVLNKESSPELVQRIMQQQDDELSKIDTPEKNNQADLYDESSIGTDSEIVERIEQRFKNSLPCTRINILLMMDMAHKQASSNQFLPL